MSNVKEIIGTKLSGATGQVNLGLLKGKFSLDFVFASTGSVSLQRRAIDRTSPGTPVAKSWITIKTYTVTISDEGEAAGEFEYQLDFTALAGNIEYALTQGQPGSR